MKTQQCEQEKKAYLIEMIGDIAHHWRQPLASISISADSIKLNHELGLLDDKELISNLDRITQSAQFLSKTLDTFKRFIVDEGEYQNINFQDSIKNILNMVKMFLADSCVEVKENFEYEEALNVYVIPVDFVQVMMNIFNNANDILLERNIEDKLIKVNVFKKDNMAVVCIEDNGGGIDEDKISKIFNPYFTTKHQSKNTGLGLHIVNKTITDNFKGKVYAQNTENGAKFTIELPLAIL